VGIAHLFVKTAASFGRRLFFWASSSQKDSNKTEDWVVSEEGWTVPGMNPSKGDFLWCNIPA